MNKSTTSSWSKELRRRRNLQLTHKHLPPTPLLIQSHPPATITLTKITQGIDIPPIMTFNSNTVIVSVFRSSLILLCTLSREAPPLLAITFLHHLASTFESYFGSPLDEGGIKEVRN